MPGSISLCCLSPPLPAHKKRYTCEENVLCSFDLQWLQQRIPRFSLGYNRPTILISEQSSFSIICPGTLRLAQNSSQSCFPQGFRAVQSGLSLADSMPCLLAGPSCSKRSALTNETCCALGRTFKTHPITQTQATFPGISRTSRRKPLAIATTKLARSGLYANEGEHVVSKV